MSLRRRAALLVTAASTLTALAAPAALADTTPPAAPSTPSVTRADLYGAGDPTYDGVWRQGFAEIAVSMSGYFVNGRATSWLLAQQCADGGWPSYRADTAKPCDPKTEDTNATGIALQALQLSGTGGAGSPAVKRGLDWLAGVQNADGGWSYNPGGPSDPDSTAVVIAGIGADAARKPNAKGKSPYDALRGFQFGCSAAPADRGAFGYPGTDGKLVPNAKATADALRGLADARLAGWQVTATATATPTTPDCAADPDAYASLDPLATATAAGTWLSAQVTKGGGHLTAVTPGSTTPVPDYGTTADAVVGLANSGHETQAEQTYAWLAANSASWAKGNPAALAQLVLAANAAHAPRASGADDPLPQLIALGPAPTKRATGAETHADEKKDDGLSSSATTWIVVGVVFVASAGFGLLLSGRKRRQP
ncbi:prenyltransferase/squalene oxidase repeat-containing protein [Streptomyces sp. NPDC021020]|uniref:prenyltransferase/squalene oxidase repeat-containing protein n=1 Tax=Streptomyces sp. NPDC021020 TaxID=3365109 RepID=UPI0037B6BE45